MNFSTESDISSQLLSCQESLFSISAIEIQGYSSISTWIGGILCLSFLFFKTDSGGLELIGIIAGGFGSIVGGAGALGNLILAPIILGNCSIDAQYAFITSIFFLVSLVVLIIGAIPSIALFIIGKMKPFYAIVIIFGFISGIAHFSGNIAAFYQWNRYNKD